MPCTCLDQSANARSRRTIRNALATCVNHWLRATQALLMLQMVFTVALWTVGGFALGAENAERKTQLSRIDTEKEHQTKLAEEATAKLRPQLVELKEKVTAKEKAVRDLNRRKRNTAQAREALEQLQEQFQELEDQVAEIQRPFLQQRDELEQERRKVMIKFPEPGDPKFLTFENRLFTEEEYEKEKTKYPTLLAEDYIQDLLKRGIIKSAQYSGTSRHAIPMDGVGTGIPIKDFVNVRYKVQYVSKAGLVNERDAWVTVLTLDGKTWNVSIRMKQLEVLGGLP